MSFAVKSLAEDLERTADPAFAVDGEGTIMAWNSAATPALGYSRRRALGSLCFDLICGKDAFGNRVCRRECLIFRTLREKRRGFRRLRSG